ncbi:MAG: hypothetical protein M1829_000085 [Trizodia sp. TS-e1964]|nr:MAG: hypothetical protein M1829_000085 [Trizodia sp. TS-e1964]
MALQRGKPSTERIALPPWLALDPESSNRESDIGEAVIKVIKTVLIVSIYSRANTPEKIQETIRRITSLDSKPRAILENIVKEVVGTSHEEHSLDIDPEVLQLYEENQKLLAENRRLATAEIDIKGQYANLLGDVNQLKEDLDAETLKRKEAEYRSEHSPRTKDSRTRNNNTNVSTITWLEQKVQERDVVILNHENTQAALQLQNESLQDQLNNLISAHDASLNNLMIELEDAKNERDQLSKKANAIDRYTTKIRADTEKMQDLQAEIRELTEALEAAKQRLLVVDGSARQYRELFEASEKALYLAENGKREMKLRYDQMSRERELEIVKHRNDVGTLETKIYELEGGVIDANNPSDSDLLNTNISTDSKRNLTSLKADLRDFEDFGSNSDENELVQDFVKRSANFNPPISPQDYLAIYSRAIEALLKALTDDSFEKVSKNSITILIIRQRFAQKDEELSVLKEKLSQIESTLSARDLDLTLAERKSGQIAGIVPETASVEIFDSMRKERDSLRNELISVRADLDTHISLLSSAILRKYLAESQTNEKALKEGSIEEDSLTTVQKQFLETQNNMIKNRERLVKAKEHIMKQNGLIEELEKRLNMLEKDEKDQKRATDGPQKVSSSPLACSLAMHRIATDLVLKPTQEEILVIQRENALMAGAWYDLTSRLQMDTLVLQRRHEAPKSWNNKQRHIVKTSRLRRIFLQLLDTQGVREVAMPQPPSLAITTMHRFFDLILLLSLLAGLIALTSKIPSTVPGLSFEFWLD